MIHEYMFDLVKVLEGALSGDNAKATAYAEQLAVRLERNGEADAAGRVRQTLGAGAKKGHRAHLARAGAKAPSFFEAEQKVEKSEYKTIGMTHDALGGALPFDEEFSLPMAQVRPAHTLETGVVLQPDAQKVVDQFVRYERESSKLNEWGVGVAPTLLLWGPPGCGKTRTADYIAAQLKLPLVTARVDAIVSSYLGSTAKNLRQLFDYAASFPCVLFLDELDALGKLRDDAHELGELKRVVISLLQSIDSLAPGQILLAATNHPHLLDPALWRRFAYKVELREPNLEQRCQMIAQFLAGWGSETITALLGAITDGMNGALIKFLTDECIRDTVLSQDGEHLDRQITLEAVQRSWRAVAFSPFVSGEAGKAQTAAPQQTWQDALFDFSLLLPRLRQIAPKTWTQTRLAQLSGLSQGQISRILASEVEQELEQETEDVAAETIPGSSSKTRPKGRRKAVNRSSEAS